MEGSGFRADGPVVLVVDDEKSILRFVTGCLKKHGYRVFQCGDGEQALEFCGKYKGEIDLLVTDVMMPGIHGGELALKLLLSRPGMAVVFMSGYPDSVVFNEKGVGHSSVFIEKPFPKNVLMDKVAEALRKRDQ